MAARVTLTFRNRQRPVWPAVVGVICALLGGLALTSQQGSGDVRPNDVVRRIIQHEILAEKRDHSHWMYLQYYSDPDKAETREVVETQWGDLQIVLSRNGHELAGKERLRQIERLKRLAMDSTQQKYAHEAQREDANKAQEMLTILPTAFQFQNKSQQGDNRVFAFAPEPSFKPSSREATVFHHMAGTLILNGEQQRLVSIEGRLISDVKFGGGILGHLEKGGWFSVRQTEVSPGYWELTTLNVEISGKALLFKTINLRQKEQRSMFRRVPDNLTLAQAADMLIATATREVRLRRPRWESSAKAVC